MPQYRGKSSVVTEGISRRAALSLACTCGLGLLTASATPALADELSDTKAKYNKAKEQLDKLAEDYERLSKEQSETQGKISDVQGQIDATQVKIDETQAKIERTQQQLDDNRARLEERVRADYKAGNSRLLQVLMSASSFDELINNLYYTSKIDEQDSQLIAQIVQAKTDLERDKTELEATRAELKEQKSELDALNEDQKKRLANMQAKQTETQKLLESLDAKVKELVAKREQEMLAAAAERRRQEEAARQGSVGGNTGSLVSTAIGSGSQARVINNAWRVGSPGAGLCAMWVSQVYAASGLGYPGGNACDMYNNWCVSANRADLRPGMIVACSSHSHTSAGRIYGHIGIYVGNGTIRDNVGYVRTISLEDWISYYSTTVTVRWGWIWGKALS